MILKLTKKEITLLFRGRSWSFRNPLTQPTYSAA